MKPHPYPSETTMTDASLIISNKIGFNERSRELRIENDREEKDSEIKLLVFRRSWNIAIIGKPLMMLSVPHKTKASD